MRPDRVELPADQLRILELVARGWTNKRIAASLHLSRATLTRRLRSLAHALSADSRVGLVTRALALGLVDLAALHPDLAARHPDLAARHPDLVGDPGSEGRGARASSSGRGQGFPPGVKKPKQQGRSEQRGHA